ncbi:MAG: DUF1598 domain-containing protein [Planctomycetota bacterium]
MSIRFHGSWKRVLQRGLVLARTSAAVAIAALSVTVGATGAAYGQSPAVAPKTAPAKPANAAAGQIAAGQIAAGQAATAKPVDNAAVEKRIAAHIAAGEFGPARVLAQNLGAAQQDAALAAMAAAQLRGGALGGFANNFRGIGNDQVRTGFMPGGFGNGGFTNGQSFFGPPPVAAGGAAMADFDSLITLIQNSTGKPAPGWTDDGGVGTVEEFRNGVFVDANGVLIKGLARANAGSLTELRSSALSSNGNIDVRRSSGMRKVSLSRLEREVQLRRLLGQGPDEAMRSLAGLQRVQYVLMYPETGDIVLAGPAGDWARDAEGRMVSLEKGRPVLQLDDLVVLLRNAENNKEVIGCSINPREENLARTKAFLDESTKRPLKPGQRDAWLDQLRDTVGKQDIVVFGLDPRTRAARIMVEADYRMKLVGMGLEEGVPGVVSYLSAIPAANGEAVPMNVLRWWFAVNYDAVQTTEGHDAFEIRGQGVKVLSENELLTERGQRVHTGQADVLNRQFTESFTKHFPALAAKYPVYAELRNIFDLALVAAIIQAQDLPGQAGWHMTYFGDAAQCPVELGTAPREVDSVVNHRVINRTQVVAGVSGGVSCSVKSLAAKDRMVVDTYGKLKANLTGSKPKNLASDSWWWD